MAGDTGAGADGSDLLHGARLSLVVHPVGHDVPHDDVALQPDGVAGSLCTLG